MRRLGSQDEAIAATAFNGVSNFVFDFTKPEVYTVEVDSSGCGIGRLGILRAGAPVILHTFEADGGNMTSLPVRYELEHVSGSAANTVCQMLQGSVVAAGPVRAEQMAYVKVAPVHTVHSYRTPVLSLKLDDMCRQYAQLQSADTFSHGPVLWEIIAAGTLTDAEWLVDGESCLCSDSSASAVVGGHVIASAYAADTSRDITTHEKFVSSIAGVGVPITLCCTSLGSQTTTVYASLKWCE